MKHELLPQNLNLRVSYPWSSPEVQAELAFAKMEYLKNVAAIKERALGQKWSSITNILQPNRHLAIQERKNNGRT